MSPSDADTGEFPLTWAQQQWMAGPPPLDENDAWRYELSLPVPVGPGLTVPDTVAIAGELVRRYPPLRSRLRRGVDGQLRQEVLAPDDPAVLDGVQRLGVWCFDFVTDALFDAGRRISQFVADPDAGNLLIVVPPVDTGGDVEISVAHAFVDASGAGALVAAFLAVLRGQQSAPIQRTCYDILDFERGERGAELSARNVRYLVSTARRAEEQGLSDPRGTAPEPTVDGCRLRSRKLLRALARSQPDSRLARAALVLALALIAFCRVRGTDGAWVTIVVGNRATPEAESFVGLAMQWGALTETLRPEDSLRTVRDRLTLRLAQSLRHGRFDPRQAEQEFDSAGIGGRPVFTFSHWESPTTDWDTARKPADEHAVQSDHYEWASMPAGAGGAGMEVNTSTLMDQALLKVKWDRRRYADARMRDYITHVERMLDLAVDDLDVPVARLRDLDLT